MTLTITLKLKESEFTANLALGFIWPPKFEWPKVSWGKEVKNGN